MSTDLALARLLQLASPALPVGAYSYSQGLEAAIEAGIVRDAATAGRWIGDVLAYSVARLEAPVWWRLHAAWAGIETSRTLLFSASLRPAVRIVGGLEVAAEVARRSQAADGELTALRGEVGWRFNENFLLAAGFTALGFSGLGLDNGAGERRDRVYLRAEAAY